MTKQYKLKELRDKHNYTQEDIASKLGISSRAYSNKENGLNDFTLTEAKKIASIFNTNIYSIFFENEVNNMNTFMPFQRIQLENN